MSADQPLYRRVLDRLTANIRDAVWPVGSRLADEIALAAELGVSRGTLRRALGELVRRGALTRVRGRGTFVNTRRIEQPLATRLISFAEAMEEQGLSFTTRVLSFSRQGPEPRVRSLLELRKGEAVYHIERVRSVGGAPVVFLKNDVPVKVCPGLSRRALERSTLFSLLEKAGRHRIEWGRRSFRAVAADAEPARRLRLPRGAPLLLLEQTVYSTRSLPLECSSVWIDSRRFAVTAVIER
jgi:GntR family transcriptional regulator